MGNCSKKIVISILSYLIFFIVFAQNVFAYSPTLFVNALDTISGMSTSFKVENVTPSSEVVFEVKNPDGNKTVFSSFSDASGKVFAKFSESNTTVVGEYRVSAYYPADGYSSSVSIFNVFSDMVSAETSIVSPANQLVNTGEKAEVVVQLMDENLNPIAGHYVKLISSDSKVTVTTNSDISDQNGYVYFEVSSQNVAAVTYTVYDMASDVILESRARIAFVNSDTVFASSVGNSSGPVESLKFENIPSKINPADSVSFTVSAYDGLDQLVSNYNGNVRFSVVGDNYGAVSLPNDYTFTLSDQGSHTFSLSLAFSQVDKYVIEVRDLDKPTVFAEYEFNVVSGSSSSLSGPGILIENPVAGTFSNDIQVVSGVVGPGERISVYDNDVLLTTLLAGIEGKFTYTTPVLADGVHNLYIAVLDNNGTIDRTSAVVTFNIDTTAPELSRIEILPDGEIYASSKVEIRMFLDEELTEAAMLFDGGIYDFERYEDSYYFVKFNAPAVPGDYNIDLVLVDLLGNETRMEKRATLNVLPAAAVVLPSVSNLIAVPNDTRIVLNWDELIAVDSQIAYYRVFYGTDSTRLIHAVDTFTNSNTWYIPKLENGVRYYFAVVAVGLDGVVGQELSNIASAVPSPQFVDVDDPNVAHGVAGSDVLQDAISDMDADVSETGPGVYWLIFVSFVLGAFYTNRKKILSLYSTL